MSFPFCKQARHWTPWIASALLASGTFGTATGAPAGASARGLATFVHGPSEAAPGGELPLVLVVYGFSQVTEAAPLPGATVEIAWDTTNIDPTEVTLRSKPVVVTSDAQGAALVRVTAPRGPGPWKLLVHTRAGDKERTDELEVKKTEAETVRVSPSTTRARAGDAIHAWTEVTAGSHPVAATRVRFDVLEGAVVVHTAFAQTDTSGRADTELRLPRGDALLSGWTIQVTTERESKAGVGVALKDDTPSTGTIALESPDVPPRPGEELKVVGILTDPTGSPVQNADVEWWGGPTNLSVAVADDKWKKLATHGKTDATGRFHVVGTMPSVIGRGGVTWLVRAAATVSGERITSDLSVAVGRNAHRLRLLPPGTGLLPGVTSNLVLTADDDKGHPVHDASFRIEGDGLKLAVKTNERGEAVATWNVPRGVGTTRQVEPCSGGVAANVAIVAEASAAAAGFPARTDLCIPVDRETRYRVRVDPPVARAGDSVRVSVDSADPTATAKTFSLVARPDDGDAGTTKIALATAGSASISTAGLEAGSYTISALGVSTRARPRKGAADPERPEEPALGRFLVVPARLPKPTATLRSQVHVPGGRASVEVRLVDDKGLPFAGTVGAIVTERHLDPQHYALRMDVRNRYCSDESRGSLRCDDVVNATSSRMQTAPAYLAETGGQGLAASQDPLRTAHRDAEETFSSVVRSLEGAVFEASGSRDTLQDVMRKEGGRSRFNPELLTLAVQALETPPLTPGGEPVSLADLVSLDPQVDYDHVARRVARYKLFKVLTMLRKERAERDVDDFAYDEPNAWLRRLLRDDKIEESALLDPWGGTMAFVKVGAGSTPSFLSPRRGYELHAPGPDGKLGTGDDVKSPFERVLRSATPYAVATNEDGVVGAQYELQVAQSSVDAWDSVLEAATGTALGGGGHGDGIGLGGYGSGGGGGGSGRGSLRGGHTTVRAGSGFRAIVAPRAVGADGVARFEVPLGEEEATYRVLLVADVPGLGRLVQTLDVPVALRQSLQVKSGDRWLVGDKGNVSVVVENRDAAVAHLEVVAEPASRNVVFSGVKPIPVDVPAHGQMLVPLSVSTPRAGAARLRLSLRERGTGRVADRYQSTWDVAAAGEPITLAEAAWVRTKTDLRRPHAEGHVPNGAQVLTLQTNGNDVLRTALLSVEPARILDRRQAEDARLLAQAAAFQADAMSDKPLATLAATVAQRALGRGSVLPAAPKDLAAAKAGCPTIPADRLFRDDPATAGAKPGAKKNKQDDHDPASVFPRFDATEQCYDQQINERVEALLLKGESVELARSVLELSEHEAREPLAVALALELRKRVHIASDGRITPAERLDRPQRTLVLAALLRSARTATAASHVQPAALVPWLLVEQDAYGSFGSVEATSAAVRALVASGAMHDGTATVDVELPSGNRTFTLAAHGVTRVSLPDGERPIEIAVRGAPVLARVIAPTLRSFLHPPLPPPSVPEVQVEWPSGARANQDVRLSVRVAPRSKSGSAELRIPLPPNVELSTKPPGDARLIGHVLRIPIPKTGFAAQFSLRPCTPATSPRRRAASTKRASARPWSPRGLLSCGDARKLRGACATRSPPGGAGKRPRCRRAECRAGCRRRSSRCRPPPAW